MNPGESTNDEVEGAGKEWSKGKDMPAAAHGSQMSAVPSLAEHQGYSRGQNKRAASASCLGHCASQ